MSRSFAAATLAALLFLLASCGAHPATSSAMQQYGEAARFDLERRSVDGSPLDMERYIRASRQARRLRSINRRSSSKLPALSLGAWEQLGPFNIAGRGRTLLLDPRDPRIMYTTGANGGIWKSTDAGANWRALDDFLPILTIGALAMDPRNPNILYAGTGEVSLASYGVRGAGIYRSTDAGASWTRLESTIGYDFRFVRSLAFSPADSNRIYAATNKGVMRTNDGGQTWTNILDRDIPHRGCQQVLLRTDRTTADYVFASCGVPAVRASGALLNKVEPGEDPNAPAAIFLNKDANGEGRWNIVLTEPQMGHSSIALAPSNQDIVYVLASSVQSGQYLNALLAVFRSTNGGDSFEARIRNTAPRSASTVILSNPSEHLCRNNTGGNQAWFVNNLAVDPLNPDRLFAASVDAFRSDDGGVTWGQISTWHRPNERSYAHADHHAFVFAPGYNGVDNQTVYTVTDGGIFRTDNALGAADLEICRGGGPGVVWRDVNHRLATTQFYHGVVYPGGQTILGGLQDNGTIRGTAGGDNFRLLTGGDGGIAAIDSLDPNTIYTAAQSFNFFRSTDGGSTFTRATTGILDAASDFAFIAPMAMDPFDSRRLWTGGRSLWRTSNGALNWSAASAPIAPRAFSAISVSPHGSNIVFAGTRTGEIFRTSEALASNSSTQWPVSKARTGWVASILHDASDPAVVYAVYASFNREPGDAHLYKSLDAGETWTALDGDQLPDAPYFSIVQHPTDPRTLFLAGDLGIFVSNDAGLTWAREDETFPGVPTQYLSIEKEGGGFMLYAFTYGRGVWRVRLSGDPAGCQYSLAEGLANVAMPAAGGVLSRNLQTGAGCGWTAFSDSTWLKVVSAASGVGGSEVRILADANTDSAARTGRVVIGDQSFQVAQSGTTISTLPAGDDPSRAVAIGELPFSLAQDTRASRGVSTVSCVNGLVSKSTWFRFQAPATATLTIRAWGVRFEDFTNPGLAIAAYPDSLTPSEELTCGMVPASNIPVFASASLNVTAGRFYLIQVAGIGAANPGGYFVTSISPTSAGVDFLPKSLDFGAVPVGAFEDRRFIIKNAGNQPLTYSLSFTDPAFTVLGQSISIAIPVGGQREWTVRFTPRAEGPAEGVLRFGNTSVPTRASGR